MQTPSFYVFPPIEREIHSKVHELTFPFKISVVFEATMTGIGALTRWIVVYRVI